LKKAFLLSALWLIPTVSTLAGPPFRTDDPIPVDYHHGEIYLFSTGTRDSDGTGGVGPALEFNYGILPDTQFHVIAPMAYDAPRDEASHFGYGDTEIEVKYRLVHETDVLPAIGVFPLLEIPTGDQDKGLGNGKAQFFLPLWLQKDFGKWTTSPIMPASILRFRARPHFRSPPPLTRPKHRLGFLRGGMFRSGSSSHATITSAIAVVLRNCAVQ
jgi:hypothetical protein